MFPFTHSVALYTLSLRPFNASSPMHQAQCIKPNASSPMHQAQCQCIKPNASSPMHQAQCQCIKPNASSPMHQAQCIKPNASSPMPMRTCTSVYLKELSDVWQWVNIQPCGGGGLVVTYTPHQLSGSARHVGMRGGGRRGRSHEVRLDSSVLLLVHILPSGLLISFTSVFLSLLVCHPQPVLWARLYSCHGALISLSV